MWGVDASGTTEGFNGMFGPIHVLTRAETLAEMQADYAVATTGVVAGTDVAYPYIGGGYYPS
jgi:hypothetical protein